MLECALVNGKAWYTLEHELTFSFATSTSIIYASLMHKASSLGMIGVQSKMIT